MKELLSRGNTKLGRRILSWGIPAVTTCPGASKECRAACYAMKGRYCYAQVKRAGEQRLEIAKSRNFVAAMTDEVRRRRPETVRVHTSGDFFSAAYVRRWRKIAEACPDTLFYAYTRSWNNATRAMRRELASLSRLSNFKLWLSADRAMPAPPKWRHTKIAYMAVDHEDRPSFHVDLTFRVRRKTVQKHVGSSLVCPVENGVTKTNCEKCRLCFTNKLDNLVELTV